MLCLFLVSIYLLAGVLLLIDDYESGQDLDYTDIIIGLTIMPVFFQIMLLEIPFEGLTNTAIKGKKKDVA